MRFIDEAVITVIAGNGGNGCISFRREKFVPKGGPDGGDGGNGGSVYLQGNRHLYSLYDLSYHKTYKAGRGRHGSGKNRHGRRGEDRIIEVPVGVDIFSYESKKLIGSILKHKERLLVAKGGKGGRGNARFVSSVRQVPRFAEDGQEGERRKIKVVLKLLSDVVIVGFPNAGKSTLLSKLTNSIPRIADYPFTTLNPNLGVLVFDDKRIVLSDIPGIIEHAHKGKGLGLRFLRHIERARKLIFLLAADDNPEKNFEILKNEIALYNREILNKEYLIVLNKMDIVKTVSFPLPHLEISAITGYGLNKLIKRISEWI